MIYDEVSQPNMPPAVSDYTGNNMSYLVHTTNNANDRSTLVAEMKQDLDPPTDVELGGPNEY